MENYKYKARNKDGKLISGEMSAEDEAILHLKLKEEGLFLESAKLIEKRKRTRRMKSKLLAEFSINLGRLIQAGVPLVKALKIVAEDEALKDKERAIYADLLKKVRSGNPLSEALLEQGETFPPLFINMVKSAEASGQLDQTILQLATYYEKEYRLNQKVKSAMTYPKILCAVLLGVVVIIIGYVMPQFKSLFAKMDKLPTTTTLLLGMSNFVVKKWYLLAFWAVVTVLAVRVICKIPIVRFYLDKLKVRAPLFGKLQRVIYSARFGRTLASLYSAGIPILTCMQIAKKTIGNTYIESQFDDAIASIRSGGNLSDAINSIDGFVKKLSSSVFVGEETGQLDNMLISIADQLDYDSEIAIGKMVTLLEPVMIVAMAVVIGFVMISVIQPIYGSYQSISKGA